MSIVDFYNVRPDELKPGDVLVCTVTLHVSHHIDPDGHPYFRMYRCGYPHPVIGDDDIPQGSRIYVDENVVANSLFPVVKFAGMKSE